MDLAHEEAELQPKQKQIKLRKTEREEKDVKAGNTETCVEASSSAPRRESKENDLKRKRMDASRDGAESQTEETREKERRTEPENKESFFTRYLLGELLGTGSFGSVYAGVRKSDGKEVALKFMVRGDTDPYITLPGDTRRLPLEVALMELVCKPPHCPYVIELLEWSQTPELSVLVLERPEPCMELFEYCDGVKMTESLARIIMQQVVQAARHCRDRGVFHRDIKEENVLLNPRTLEVKLIDFGCGDLLKDAPYTEFAGTLDFAAPEWFVEGKYEAEPATVWGLGVLLYSLLCREDPFDGAQEIVDGQLQLPDHLSEESCSLIQWCLQRDPKKRPTLDQIFTHHWF